MRITVVQGPFLPIPPLLGGAVEKIWFRLGNEFAARNHAVTYISRKYNGLAPRESKYGVDYIRVKGADRPGNRIAYLLLDLIYALRVMFVLPEADVLVTHSLWLPLLLRRRRCGALYVHVARFPKGQMAFYQHAARLQAVSNVVAEQIRKELPNKREIVSMVPNPLPFEIPGTEILAQFPPRKKVILFVGRIHPEKGVELLVRAFNTFVRAGHLDWRLVLVGPWQSELGGGGRAYFEKLRAVAEDMAEMVDWAGPIFDVHALNQYHRHASLFVYPSLAERGESFGLAPLEAMANGCPALVSDLACFRDFIEPGRTGFVFNHRAPDPVKVLAEQLEMVTGDASLLGEVASRGHVVSQQYSLAKVATLFLQDFELATACD